MSKEGRLPHRVRRNLRYMSADGIFFSVMVGAGETFLPAFVLAVGLGELASGLITSIPLLTGALLQLLAPWVVQRLGSHRRFVVTCATIQALSFVPLVAAAWTGSIPTWGMFLVASIYWGFGMATGPAWNTWAETLVPRKLRAGYFACRTRLSQAGTLIGFLLGGLGLQYAATAGYRLQAFGVLFLIAGLSRFLSARFLAAQDEQVTHAGRQTRVGLGEFFRRFRAGGNEQLLGYLVAMQFGVYVSGPYFNPYMLGQLQIDYRTYVLLVATSFVAKVVSLPLWGVVARRSGARRLLWIGGIGIVPLAAGWTVSTSLPWFFLMQFAGGVTWAAYELAMLLLFFETIKRDERTSLLTLYNVGNALAMVLGSLVGGAVLKALGPRPESYLAVFMLSSCVRLTTVIWLFRLPRFTHVPTTARPGLRTVGLDPTSGAVHRPILPSLQESAAEVEVVAEPERMPGGLPRTDAPPLVKTRAGVPGGLETAALPDRG